MSAHRNGRELYQSEFLERRLLLAAHPTLVKDVNQTTDMLNPGFVTNSNGVGFFTGQNIVFDGAELWKTDGTKAGTVLVKDINPGLTSSNPASLTDVNGTLFFSANDGVNGTELWKSDGTTAGTVLVKNIASGSSSSSPTNLTNVNGVLFFNASNQLWKSDGTSAGTVQVVASGGPTNPATMVNLNGTLIFAGTSTSGDREIWKSDGTSAGTVQIANINTGTLASSNPTALTVWNNAVYFKADSGATASPRGDLYRTDGASVVLVKQINLDSNDQTNLFAFTPSGNTLYFIAVNTPLASYQLWKTDGTDPGTIPLLTNAAFNSITRLQSIGTNSLLFANISAAAGSELWVSNGTVAGTTILKDIIPGTANGFNTFTTGSTNGLFTRIGSTAYFNANKTDGTQELWKSDGTAAATVRVADPLTGLLALAPLGSVNSTLLFLGTRAASQGDLWKSDGTAAGTGRLGATATGNGTGLSSVIVSNYGPAFYRDGETMYFAGNDGINGNELWRTDPAQGAVRVSDIFAGNGSSDPAELVKTDDGTIYFSATTPATGRELYKMSPGGSPTLVGDIATGSLDGDPRFLAPVGNLLYFNGKDNVGGIYLYRYDPATNTIAKATTSTGANLTSPFRFTRAGSLWYFQATLSNNGAELWRTDGTAAGTVMVADINPSSNSSNPNNLTAAGSTLYFSATDATHGTELWKTDGTTTSMIADMTAGSGSTSLSQFFYDGTRLLFDAAVNNGAETLWRSDGTTVTQIGAASGALRQFTMLGGATYFLGSDASGNGLFKLVGDTVARMFGGTTATLAIPAALFGAGGKLFVIGRVGLTPDRFDLWRSDGVPGDQVKIAELQPRITTLVDGSYWVLGQQAVGWNSTHLYFPQYSAALGIEPHRLPLVDPTGSISGSVFDDVNNNGVRDVADAGLAGVTVYLDADGNGQLNGEEFSTVTDANGNYTLTEIEDGSYKVRVVVPAGKTQSTPAAAGFQSVTIAGGTANPNKSFGVTQFTPLRAAAAFGYQSSELVTVAFNSDVSSSLTGDDLQVVNLTNNNEAISPSVFTFNQGVSGGATTATWSTTALGNGNYRITLPQTSVTSSAGSMSGDFTYDFYVLAADGDRNRVVDINDFNILAVNFGKSGQTFAQGNYNYSSDGKVSIEDFNILAVNFGKRVDALAGAFAVTQQPAARFAIESPQAAMLSTPAEDRLVDDLLA